MKRHTTLLVFMGLLGCSPEQEIGVEPLVDASCRWMRDCCSEGEIMFELLGEASSEEACAERVRRARQDQVDLGITGVSPGQSGVEGLLRVALSVDLERSRIREDALIACIETADQSSCQPPSLSLERCTPEDARPWEHCGIDELLEGTQGADASCRADHECKPSLFCAEEGRCRARAEHGQPCFSPFGCAPEDVCSPATGTCVTGKTLSEPCSPESDPCAGGLRCDDTTQTCVGTYCAMGAACSDVVHDTDCPAGLLCHEGLTCGPPKAAGEPCTRDVACESGVCDAESLTCVAMKSVGDLCTTGVECASGFCNGARCDVTVENGSVCASHGQDECANGYCDVSGATPVCRAFRASGESCTLNVECERSPVSACVQGVCATAPFEEGVDCEEDVDCESNLCFLGECTAMREPTESCSSSTPSVPCVPSARCQVESGAVDGVCVELGSTGTPCTNADECAGECVPRGARMLCAPASTAEPWCDAD